MSTRHFALALCAGAALGAPAHAAIVDLSAEVTRFQYQLIDLDLTDGITPALTIDSATAHARSRSLSPGDIYGRDEIHRVGSTGLSGPFGQASASTESTRVAATATIGEGASYGQSYLGESTYELAFTLTPNTGLAVSALGAMSILKPVAEFSRASIALQGYMNNWGGGWDESSSFLASYQATIGNGLPASETFALSGYLYTDHQGRSGVLNISALADATVTSSVPEPGAYAMLLAGVVLIGARVRKTAQRSISSRLA